MIDAILTNTVLPKISEEFLKRMMEAKPIERVHGARGQRGFRSTRFGLSSPRKGLVSAPNGPDWRQV
jgi:hypothetical protein